MHRAFVLAHPRFPSPFCFDCLHSTSCLLSYHHLSSNASAPPLLLPLRTLPHRTPINASPSLRIRTRRTRTSNELVQSHLIMQLIQPIRAAAVNDQSVLNTSLSISLRLYAAAIIVGRMCRIPPHNSCPLAQCNTPVGFFFYPSRFSFHRFTICSKHVELICSILKHEIISTKEMDGVLDVSTGYRG